MNYFFAYSMDDDQIGDYLDGLAELCSDPMTRGKIFVAVGMEDFSNREAVTTHVEKCLSRLRTDYVDAFFLEYVCRGDEDAANETMGWMRGAGGLVVAEGAGLPITTHRLCDCPYSSCEGTITLTVYTYTLRETDTFLSR